MYKRTIKETGVQWDKGSYRIELHESPPTRLLSIVLPIAAWLGWIMHEKYGEKNQILSSEDSLKRIEEAFCYGVNLSKKRETP
jgi:hypothetical protein